MDGKAPSFGRLVFGRAISDTVRFLGYTARDLILGSIALFLGVVCAYVFVGKADTMKEVALFLAFTLAPGGIILLAVFLWHLWLAPAALAYETSKESYEQTALAISAISGPRAESAPYEPPSVKWEIWKRRTKYTVSEFAAILAKDDPVGMEYHMINRPSFCFS